MSLESLLDRLYDGTPSATGVIGATATPPAPGAVTPVAPGISRALQPEPYRQAACTPVTPANEDGEASAAAAHWLAAVARHLDTTPGELLAAGVILPDDVPHYRDRDPRAMADALRRAHPGRFTTREPDDRRHCRTCSKLAGARCRARNLLVMDDLPRRCSDYQPAPDDPDQRPGRERWPDLLTPLEASTP